MDYEGQICRAPMERGAYMLPVMVGCSYNRCRFCNLFRHLKFRLLPMSQIEAELERVQRAGGVPRKIFLGDGNAFDLRTEYLLEIMDRIDARFPGQKRINMDATVTGILKKTPRELRQLQERGVRHLYLGIESGLDDVLRFMEKDHTLEQAYEAAERLRDAGLIYDAHIMTGVAGRGRGIENAEALAAFLNATRPAHVVNFSLFLHRETPLCACIADGRFLPADEGENLAEEQRLIELLCREDGQRILYDGFHDYIRFRVRGELPGDRGRMLKKLERQLEYREAYRGVYAYVEGNRDVTGPDAQKYLSPQNPAAEQRPAAARETSSPRRSRRKGQEMETRP